MCKSFCGVLCNKNMIQKGFTMLLKKVLVSCLFVLTAAPTALACGIEGSVHRTDGSKVNKTATISTSWNGQTVVPANGKYKLDLGNNVCGESITVYINHNTVGRYKIPKKGYAVINIVLKGDKPVATYELDEFISWHSDLTEKEQI